MPYLSTAQLKTYLGIAVTETADDALLEPLITAAQAIIDAGTGRTFEAASDSTRRFDAVRDVCGPLLTLDYDLCQITSITNGDGATISSTQYVLEPRNVKPAYAIRLKPSSGVVWQFKDDAEDAIAIVGRWAYSVTPPADIVQATRRLAAHLYRQKDSSLDMDRPTVSPDGVTLMPSRIPADVAAVIRSYRRMI